MTRMHADEERQSRAYPRKSAPSAAINGIRPEASLRLDLFSPPRLRSCCILAIAVALVLSGVQLNVASAATIRLRDAATTASPVVTLGDVADVLDPNPITVEHLRSLTLAPAPPPGEQVRLDYATIRSRLQALGISLAMMELSGASAVVVTSTPPPAQDGPSARALPDWKKQRAQHAAAEAVSQHLQRRAPQAGKLRIELEIAESDLQLIAAGRIMPDRITGLDPASRESQQITIPVQDTQGHGTSATAVCRLSPLPQALVVRHALPRGHILRQDDLAWQQTDSGKASGLQPQDVIGLESTRPLRAAEVLQPADIRRVPLVRGNDIVTVYARRPGITVRRIMKARGEGAMGDSLSLVSLDGRETVLAQVIGYHEAQVLDSPP